MGPDEGGVVRRIHGQSAALGRVYHLLHALHVAHARVRVGQSVQHGLVRTWAQPAQAASLHVVHSSGGGSGLALRAEAADAVRPRLGVQLVLARKREERLPIQRLDDASPLVNPLALRGHARQRLEENTVELIEVGELARRKLGVRRFGRCERVRDLLDVARRSALRVVPHQSKVVGVEDVVLDGSCARQRGGGEGSAHAGRSLVALREQARVDAAAQQGGRPPRVASPHA